MFFRAKEYFKHSWLWYDPVNGPALFNARLVEDEEERMYEAEDLVWGVDCRLVNDIIEAEQEFHWEYDGDQLEMEIDLYMKWGFGYVLER